MNIRDLIHDHLKKARIMQLATCVNNQPWVCNLHFYADKDFNFYWLSKPDRRHSKEIERNSKVSIAVKVHEDTPSEKYVIGVSVEGEATLLEGKEAEKAIRGYAEKLGTDSGFIKDVLKGSATEKFYRFKASRIVLFDNKNFPDSPRQELLL